MIEEIKLVLDSIGDLSGVALWVVGFFLVFKLVVYLSTTGAIVYLVKMAITNGTRILTRGKVINYDLNGHITSGVSKDAIDKWLDEMKICTGVYLHESDIRDVTSLVKQYKEEKLKK